MPTCRAKNNPHHFHALAKRPEGMLCYCCRCNTREVLTYETAHWAAITPACGQERPKTVVGEPIKDDDTDLLS